jgi:hypothetical protein
MENNETEIQQHETTVTEDSVFQNGAVPKIHGFRKGSAQKTSVSLLCMLERNSFEINLEYQDLRRR